MFDDSTNRFQEILIIPHLRIYFYVTVTKHRGINRKTQNSERKDQHCLLTGKNCSDRIF